MNSPIPARKANLQEGPLSLKQIRKLTKALLTLPVGMLRALGTVPKQGNLFLRWLK